MKFINFAIVKFSLCLMLGIILAHLFPISFSFLFPLLLFFVLIGIFWFLSIKKLSQTVYLGVATYLCFITLGYFSYQVRMAENRPNHYSHSMANTDFQLIQLKIRQSLKPDDYYNKYLAQVQYQDGKKSEGKILLNILKDSSDTSLKEDEVILLYGTITQIPQPLNPYQFDYSRYMNLLEVYGQIRLSNKNILRTKRGNRTLYGAAQLLRAGIIEKLSQTNLQTGERSIIQALVLGEKKDIDSGLYRDYAAAGAVHILAVSGLHVGILYFILSYALGFFRRIKYGLYLHSIFIVLLLWGFAFLSGLSPSVTRAVTMFTFFALARLFGRNTNALNTLFLSLLSLLLINPKWLFQVGFQLSYLAVFFIVWLHPVFDEALNPKHWLNRKIWGIITVTICAQLGVFPLTLYYFHQFPGLFLLTNLVVLPFLTLLMIGGILIVILASLNILPYWLSNIYNSMIESLNIFIQWVAQQDAFLFRDIHFSVLKVVCCYLLIICIGWTIRQLLLGKSASFRGLITTLVFACLLITVFIFEKIKATSAELIVFHKSRSTLIGVKNGAQFRIFKNDTIQNHNEKYPVNTYLMAKHIRTYSEDKMPQAFKYKNKRYLVVDSTIVIFPRQKVHTLLLSDSPKINLTRWIDSLEPKHIIVHGSNYPSYVARWKKTCENKKLRFTNLAKDGAFRVR